MFSKFTDMHKHTKTSSHVHTSQSSWRCTHIPGLMHFYLLPEIIHMYMNHRPCLCIDICIPEFARVPVLGGGGGTHCNSHDGRTSHEFVCVRYQKVLSQLVSAAPLRHQYICLPIAVCVFMEIDRHSTFTFHEGGSIELHPYWGWTLSSMCGHVHVKTHRKTCVDVQIRHRRHPCQECSSHTEQ